MPASNFNSVPLQLEAVRKRVIAAFGVETTLFDLIKSRGDVLDASTRNARLPQLIRPGGKGSQGTGDFDDMGRGSGSIWEVGTLSTLQFRWAIEISKLAEYATDEKTKAVDSVPVREAAEAIENFKSWLDAAMNTNGTTQLDTVVSFTGTSPGPGVITVNNADMFYFNEDIMDYPSGLASAARGLMTVTYVDPALNTIGVNTLPAGFSVGDALCYNVSQGAGGANPIGIEGLLYNHVDSQTGTWNNLSRTTYPEALKTPHVAAAGAGITPGIRRLGTQKMRRILMSRYKNEDKITYWGVDQESAWENTGITITENIYQQIKGDYSEDMLKKEPPKSFGGIKAMTSMHATRARIDVILPGHWGKVVTKEFGPFEEGGQTVFPIYAPSGGLAAGYIEYFDIVFNTFLDQPRYGLFWDGLSVPNGY
jgi:hypothetical protein